jgi:putative ABC transport system permease protein
MLWARMMALLKRGELDQRISEELQTHLDLLIEENLRRGLPPDQARHEARRAIGNLTFTAESYRTDSAFPRIETFWQDLRHTMRILRQNPGFTSVAVGMLAVGIAANTAIFTLVDAVLLRPLPYPEADRLVSLSGSIRGVPGAPISVPDFYDWSRQSRSFTHLSAMFYPQSMNLNAGGEPQRIVATPVTARFFDVFAVPPLLGRSFRRDEEGPQAPKIVVLSFGAWQRLFAGDPRVAEKNIDLDGQSYRVVGVMPARFNYPEDRDAWVPLTLNPREWPRQAKVLDGVVGRVASGVPLAGAQSEMDVIAQRLESAFPDANRGWGIRITPLQESIVGDSRTAVLILCGAVGFVLMLVCVNVANLLLARGAVRRRELTIRCALGAGRARIFRQLVTESIAVSAIAGVIGALLAHYAVLIFRSVAVSNLPRAGDIGIDAAALAFNFAAALMSGVAVGVLPAWRAARSDIASDLRDAGRASAVHARSRLRSALVVAEIAISILLLAGAGLLLRSFREVLRVPPGFNPAQVMTFELSLPRATYGAPPRVAAFAEAVRTKLGEMPGVVATGMARSAPLRGDLPYAPFTIAGDPALAVGEKLLADYQTCDPGFLRALSIPLIRGRVFADHDRFGSNSVVLINESLSRRYFAGRDAIGRKIVLGFDREPRTVVGIVGDVRYRSLEVAPRPAIYLPFAQSPVPRLAFVVRTERTPETLGPELREQIRQLDPRLPVFGVETMDTRMARSTASRRWVLSLIGTFAIVAVLLAAIGIYGVMSYMVMQRTHEIGIRMALGARAGEIIRLIAGQGMRLAGAGTVVGIGGALCVARFLTTLLFQVRPTDPLVYVSVAVLLLVVAGAAVCVPIWRALRVEPVIALRHE